MINIKYLELPEHLINEYKTVFKENDGEKKFLFLRKFLKFVEDDFGHYNCYIKYENPSKKNQDEEMKVFNETIRSFLIEMSSIQPKTNSMRKLKSNSYVYIGVGYEFGLFGYPLNEAKAVVNYTTSAQLKSDIGTYRLAHCYEKGCGVKKSDLQAICFYRCSAKLGHIDAMYVYGIILMNGYLGAAIDEKTGWYYLQVAAKKASEYCPYPLFDVGIIYETGSYVDISIDKSYSKELFLRGARLGDPNCKFKLAQCFEFGELLCVKDSKRALNYYEEAANGGHVEAMFFMTTHLKKGTHRLEDKSHKKYFSCIQKAACKMNQQALIKCVESYEKGYGTDQDILMSLLYYKIAVDNGNVNAKERMYSLESEIVGLDKGIDVSSKCPSCFTCTS
ncbi:SKT5 [Hepatospora eriocheir]|uniref:SKT5 n=1 Tax=Hepatospora eriocheir TaxID=1081669 RepID=A0A1X0QKH7_9MICR|nr:SKT5 [Hepatospora eriocheir]